MFAELGVSGVFSAEGAAWAVLGDDAIPAELEIANRLERATAVANEAMRLLPVAPLNFMQANHDTVLGDIAVPEGTGVLVLGRIPATDAQLRGSARVPPRPVDRTDRRA